MITSEDFYNLMCATVPLYVAMLLAYGSVKWWKIFTPEQCSGINRFVAVFAIPILSFPLISQNNPYQMDTHFILADTLSKLVIFLLLSLWTYFSSSTPGSSRLDWLITLFSIATLPNTLVIGIPLLGAMYGNFTQSLMVQLVVLQSVIWFTLLLLLFEYRAATLLIREQFPGAAAATVAKFEVAGDVMSLDRSDVICAESEIDADGQVCVRIRKPVSSLLDSGLSPSARITPRLSNFSMNTSGRHLMEQFTPDDVAFGCQLASLRHSRRASPDAYSSQLTPTEPNFTEGEKSMPACIKSPVESATGGRMVRQPQPAVGGEVKVVRGCHEGGTGAGGEGEGDKNVGVQEEAEEMDGRENQEKPRVAVMLKLILTMVGRKLSRNPNIYASFLGLFWSLISFKWKVSMPRLVMNSIKIISDAGLGMAMFSLGLFMALQPKIIACGAKMATISMMIRFIGGPMIMAAASMAVGLRGIQLHTAIIQAALPLGIVPFIFAKEYGLHPEILSTGVIFSMLIFLPIMLLYYIFLGL